jgi:glycerophosphoryl diester phosphodiesterase
MQVFGHRGSPGFPRFGENTRTSFRKALDVGADGFELDVRRCADETIVVLHDATIDRTTNGTGRLRDFSYNQLSGIDAGYGDSIPRLSDILDEFGARCTIHVELKEAGLAREVTALAVERDLAACVVISAFDIDDNDASADSSWSDLASVATAFPTALLISTAKLRRMGPRGFIEAARQCGARGLHTPRDGVTKQLIDLAREAALPVRVWTVNQPAEALSLEEMGIDAIFTDCPDRCIHALHR